jgi:hypothetical protein
MLIYRTLAIACIVFVPVLTAQDRSTEVAYNRVLWEGMKGKKVPYPTVRDGRDLSHDHDSLLCK